MRRIAGASALVLLLAADALAERRVEFALREERVWERRAAFLDLNPSCEVPVLVESEGATVVGAVPAAEYLDETTPGETLIGIGAPHRAERRAGGASRTR